MRIIYVDGTETHFHDDVRYSICKTITTFSKIKRKENPEDTWFRTLLFGKQDIITEKTLMTVYNSQIKAIIP